MNTVSISTLLGNCCLKIVKNHAQNKGPPIKYVSTFFGEGGGPKIEEKVAKKLYGRPHVPQLNMNFIKYVAL